MENRNDEFEKSLTTTYRISLWSKFIKAIKTYQLIQPNDKICVCISGGKDSMCMAKLFQTLQKHSDFPFEVKYIVMNPGYNEINLQYIKNNLDILGIPAEIHETNIFEIANMQTKSPCFLCAKMRRGALYQIAKDSGCNKIALGHHYDDVIVTTLMNLLNAGSFQTMLPKLHSEHFEGLELIRPLYLIHEDDIIRWKNHHNLQFIQCACRFTEKSENEELNGERAKTKKLIAELMKENPFVEKNIFKSASNVNLNMILGYKKDGQKVSFLDDYDLEKEKEENHNDN